MPQDVEGCMTAQAGTPMTAHLVPYKGEKECERGSDA
jgi:hypothetical protein